MDEMNSCVFTRSVDRSEDDSPPVCLVELINSKTKVVTSADDKSDGLSNTVSSEDPLPRSIDLDNTHLPTMKEPSSLTSNHHANRDDNESLTGENYLQSKAKISTCDLEAEDEDDVDLEDRPLTVDTQESDEALLNESSKKTIPSTNNSVCTISNSVAEDKQDPTSSVTTASKTSFVVINNTPSAVVCLSSSLSSCQSTLSLQNCQSTSVPNKNCSSDGHHTSAPVALATVAPIRMSSVGPDYSLSNEILRPIKPASQDTQTNTVMSNHATPQTVTSIFPSKHEAVSTTSTVSYNPKSSQSSTNERFGFPAISITKPASIGTTSVTISIAPTISSSVITTHSMPSIFNVRTRPTVAQSVLPVLSVGPQPAPPLNTQTSLSSLQSQSTVQFMPLVGNMPVTMPVPATSTGLRNVINHNQAIPIAGAPTAPCPPLQIFNMTPMPQFMGTPSYVLHPTGPVAGANSFQFPQGSTHLLPGLSGSAGVGGTTFNFLQPQNYPSTIFPQPPTIPDLLIDPQNPMGLGHSVLTPPASIALISAINNPSSSSFTSIYPTLLHQPNQNFFPTSSTHSGPVSYPYSTALAAGTHLVNATAPQMATSLVPAAVTNLPNMHNSNETSFMFQSGPPHGTSFISSNFAPNPGQLFPPCQFPTFPNLFQTNDNCLTNTFISSSLPTDLTSTCDTKSSLNMNGSNLGGNGGTCLSTYWPYVSSNDLINPTSIVQATNSTHQTDFLQSVNNNNNNLNDRSKMNDVNTDNSGILNVENINDGTTTTTTITINPLTHAPINSSINSTLTTINTATTTNITSALDNGSHNKNNIPLNSSTVVLPAIRRRRRLFAQNGIKPITNVIQSPFLNHTNSMNDESNNSTVMNSTGDDTNNPTVSDSLLCANVNNSNDNDDNNNDNSVDNDANGINNSNRDSLTTCDNELKQSDTIQSPDKLTPSTKSSASTIPTFRSNTLPQSVEDVQLCNQISTDIEFTSKLSKEIQQKDSVEYDDITKLPSSSSSSSCSTFISSSVMVTTIVTTQLIPTMSTITMTSNTTITPSQMITTSFATSPDATKIHDLNHNADSSVSSTSLPFSPSNADNSSKTVYKNSDLLQNESKMVSVGKSDDKEAAKNIVNNQMKSPVSSTLLVNNDSNNTSDQKDSINENYSKLLSTVCVSSSGSNNSIDASSTTYSKLKSTITPFEFPPPPVLIGPDDRRILTHYIDGHIIYESDKPFPVKNGMIVVETALMKQQSCLVSSTNSPLKTFLINGYEDGVMSTVKSPTAPSFSSLKTTAVKPVDNHESEALIATPSRLPIQDVGGCGSGWINPLKASNSSSLSIVDKHTNHPGSIATSNSPAMLLHYETRRRKPSNEQQLYNDIHDENDSSPSTSNHYHQPTQGILASYPHSTILSLANRNSASVVYTQSPIVSIPSRNDRQSSSDMKGGNELTVMDGKSIESYSHHSQYQHTESSTSLSKPLNEIQSSSGIMMGLTSTAFNQSTCQQRLPSIAQAMYGISQTITPSFGLLTPNPPPKGPIYKWTPDDVVAFVRGTPGCGAYASAFLNNEIDGEALLLLAEDQFIQPPIGMKIGPALKLVARLESLKNCC
uniref:SAM domain-containing protein n=1 Tax=Schistosoma mansoni TaxID=6183 RepID=A0A5K4F1B8_SCHMA